LALLIYPLLRSDHDLLIDIFSHLDTPFKMMENILKKIPPFLRWVHVKCFSTVAMTLGCFLLCAAAGSAIIVGCATPYGVGPTQQPWGQTPALTPFFAPGPGLQTLPSGFRNCGDYVAPVTMSDGSTVLVRICIYCSSDPNDTTVYVQQDCTGPYRPAQRNPNPGAPSSSPTTRPLSKLSGDLSFDVSTISFVVDAPFEILPKNTKDSMAQMVIDGVDLVASTANGGPQKFPAGTKVMITGDNASVADLMLWNFGVGHLQAVTDFGCKISLEAVYTKETGANLIVRVDGERQPGLGGMMPWRGE